MNTADKCRGLAEAIISYFKDGITLDRVTKGYIGACFPNSSFQDLAARIREKPSVDDASLMELIFYPNEALQIRLEPILEKDVFLIEDEANLTRLLLEAGIHTTLREAESAVSIPIEIPPPVLVPFVRRLRISRRLPRRLIDAIHDIFSPAESARLKVGLRNGRFPFSPEITGFLKCFLTGVDPAADYFRDCFDLVLALLHEQKGKTGLFLLLMAKRDLFTRAKEAAVLFMRRLEQNNMETLMQQGIRAPEISIEEADRKIELLGRILAATEAFDDPL